MAHGCQTDHKGRSSRFVCPQACVPRTDNGWVAQRKTAKNSRRWTGGRDIFAGCAHRFAEFQSLPGSCLRRRCIPSDANERVERTAVSSCELRYDRSITFTVGIPLRRQLHFDLSRRGAPVREGRSQQR